MMRTYIEVDGEPVLCRDHIEWGNWFANADRIVARTVVGDREVLTLFTGIDHNFGHGTPLVYESVVFVGDGVDEDMNVKARYPTRGEALKGHETIVDVIRALLDEIHEPK